MKTKFSLATVFLLFLILSSFDIPNSTLGSDCPASSSNPPPVVLDPSKRTCCLLPDGFPHCFKSNSYLVPLFFQFEYVLEYENGSILDYELIGFDFNIEDLHGNPLNVYSPASASGNSFYIAFDYANLTNVPSGPYGAYIENTGKKRLIFNLNYTTAPPPAYPADFTIRSNVNVYVKEHRQRGSFSSAYWIESTICSEGAIHQPGSRIGDSNLENQLVKAYPNPFTNYVELQVQAPEAFKPEIQVLNINGQNMNLPARLKYAGDDLWIASVDTQTLPAGVYIYQTKYENKIITQKLIKH